jgi:hypothetical protein
MHNFIKNKEQVLAGASRKLPLVDIALFIKLLLSVRLSVCPKPFNLRCQFCFSANCRHLAILVRSPSLDQLMLLKLRSIRANAVLPDRVCRPPGNQHSAWPAHVTPEQTLMLASKWFSLFNYSLIISLPNSSSVHRSFSMLSARCEGDHSNKGMGGREAADQSLVIHSSSKEEFTQME